MRTDRIYYRSNKTGDLGYIVEKNGVEFIQLDRPNEEIIRPFKPAEWSVDREIRPLTQFHVAQVAFEADKRLCFYLGDHRSAKKKWDTMPESERIDWLNNGPKDPPIRDLLWKSILKTLDPITE